MSDHRVIAREPIHVAAYTDGMSMDAAEIERAMLALDRRDLAALIRRGIQALDDGDATAPQNEIDAAWRDEVAQRIDDVRSGKVTTTPLEDSFAEARAAIAASRR